MLSYRSLDGDIEQSSAVNTYEVVGSPVYTYIAVDKNTSAPEPPRVRPRASPEAVEQREGEESWPVSVPEDTADGMVPNPMYGN